MYVYMYMHVCLYVCVCMYVCLFQDAAMFLYIPQNYKHHKDSGCSQDGRRPCRRNVNFIKYRCRVTTTALRTHSSALSHKIYGFLNPPAI